MKAYRQNSWGHSQRWIGAVRLLIALLAMFGLETLAEPVPAEPPAHAITGISRPDSSHVRVNLAGDLSADYQPYFDLFPVETSTDLQEWTVADVLLRTNRVVGSIWFAQPSEDRFRFYRTPGESAPTAFPKPTGPYRVGAVSRLFSSATRNSTVSGPNRKFMASIFYPAAAGPWIPSENIVAPAYVADMFNLLVLANPRPFAVVTSLVSHAANGLGVRANSQPYPVLLYCHGGTYFRRDNIHKLCELASHGYIVVAADYYHAWYSYYPDGSVVAGSGFIGDGEEYCVTDTVFLLDELGSMNASDPMFQGRLDLSRVGILGWSVGGAQAGDICRLEPRVKAAVLYDAAFWIAPGLTQEGLDKPFLCINATIELEPGWSTPAVDLFRKASQDAIFFQLTGTRHEDYSDLMLVDEPGATQLNRAAVVMDYTRAFFNRYLLGTTEPLLNGPKNGAGITNWKKK